MYNTNTCSETHLTEERLALIKRKYPTLYAEYKVKRINEMSCYWKGKPHEPYTVPLLAMLLQENGALDPLVRGDYGYAIGISQHHICNRVTFGKHYCNPYAKSQFEKEHPEFATEWKSQFWQFSDVIRGYIEKNMTVDSMIDAWNSKEYNRRWKVSRWEEFVRLSIK